MFKACIKIWKSSNKLLHLVAAVNREMLTRVFCLQFLHAETDRRSVLESHLLLLTEDGCECVCVGDISLISNKTHHHI